MSKAQCEHSNTLMLVFFSVDEDIDDDLQAIDRPHGES